MPATQTDRLYGLTTSVAVKAPVRVASTGNLTLSSTQVIDGVAVSTGDRVLVKDQTGSTNNGIYEVRSGTWARTADFDGQFDCVRGTAVYISTGTAYGDTWFRVSSTGVNVPGSSAISFSQAGQLGQLITISTFAETLLDDSTASDMRTTLVLGNASTLNVGSGVQAYDVILQDISALTLTTGAILYYTGSSMSQVSGSSTGMVLFGGPTPVFGSLSNALSTGTVRQSVYASTSAVMTTTTIIPGDNTIPTSTEGAIYLSASITPNSTANTLDAEAIAYISALSTDEIAVAMFRTGSTLAIATGFGRASTGGTIAQCFVVRHQLSATSTSSITFDMYYGPSTADTTTLNGFGSTQRHGGVLYSSLRLLEIRG